MEKNLNNQETFEQYVNKLIKQVSNIKISIEQDYHLLNMEIHVPNIGITYYNKISQISKYYRDHGLNFYESKLFLPILNYISIYIDNANEIMSSYLKYEARINTFSFFKKQYIRNFKKGEKILDDYNDMNDKLYKFSLQEDLVGILLVDILYATNQNEDPKKILEYEDELLTLGLNMQNFNDLKEKVLNTPISEKDKKDGYKVLKLYLNEK